MTKRIRFVGLVMSGFLCLLVFSLCACTRKTAEHGPALTIMYNAEEQPAEKSVVAQIIQAQLASHGIITTLEPVTNTIFYDRLAKGEFQAALALWYLDYNDPEGFLTDFYSKASFRMSKYSNPTYDQEYLEGLFAPSETDKIKHFRAAAEVIDKELPWIPLYSNDEIFLLRSGAAGFRSNAYQYYDYRRVQLRGIRVASDVEIQTLDPALTYDLGSKHIVCQSYEGLVTMSESLQIIPALATKWSFSKNGDALTFNLRPHILFHESSIFTNPAQREMTAEDVRASFERMLKLNSPYSYIFDYVKGVEDFKSGKTPHVAGFRIVDRLTFQINLVRPFPTMLSWLLAPAAYILPKELPPGYDFAKGSVGTGPFVLKSFDGSVATFSRNPDYWLRAAGGEALPEATTLSIRVIKDVNTLLAAFRHGDLDLLDVPVALYTDIFDAEGNIKQEWQGYVYRDVKLNNLKFLCFNMQAAPWGRQLGLREQVAAAIDRKAIVRQLFRGKARVATSVVPSGVYGFGTESNNFN